MFVSCCLLVFFVLLFFDLMIEVFFLFRFGNAGAAKKLSEKDVHSAYGEKGRDEDLPGYVELNAHECPYEDK